MSDTEHTTQGGVDWELRTAEAAMVAAPGGGSALAQAMQRHADGVRNMMQSELVPSFEHAIDKIMAKHVGKLSDEIGGLKDGQDDLQAEFRAGLSRIQQTVSALVETVDTLQGQMNESQNDRSSIHAEIAAVKVDVATVDSKVEELRREIDALKQAQGDDR